MSVSRSSRIPQYNSTLKTATTPLPASYPNGFHVLRISGSSGSSYFTETDHPQHMNTSSKGCLPTASLATLH